MQKEHHSLHTVLERPAGSGFAKGNITEIVWHYAESEGWACTEIWMDPTLVLFLLPYIHSEGLCAEAITPAAGNPHRYSAAQTVTPNFLPLTTQISFRLCCLLSFNH